MAPSSIEGPGFWTIDLALSRLVSIADQHNVEFRLEMFNLLNNFNWGDPVINYDVWHVRPDHDHGRCAANHPAWSEVRLLADGPASLARTLTRGFCGFADEQVD